MNNNVKLVNLATGDTAVVNTVTTVTSTDHSVGTQDTSFSSPHIEQAGIEMGREMGFIPLEEASIKELLFAVLTQLKANSRLEDRINGAMAAGISRAAR